MWERVARLLSRRPGSGPRLPVAERFALFRAVGAANDTFLRNLAALREKVDGAPVPGMGTVEAAHESLTTPIAGMVKALAAMRRGRYDDLLARYEALEHALAEAELQERPEETGPLVVWPGETAAARPQVVGPKAARLSDLRGDDLHVPDFFVVTVNGYRRFMEASGLDELVHQALTVCDPDDVASVQGFSETVTRAIAAAALPVELGEALEEGFRRLRGSLAGGFAVAVRSSAVVEDAESSFAGQFESVLDVGMEGLAAAYKRVVASKYRVHALNYARVRGFLDEDVAMPVLVMAMVRARAAGVAYSRSAERSDCAVVTAVRGLAQALVDGSVVPDTFLIAGGGAGQVVDLAARGSPVSRQPEEGDGARVPPREGGAPAAPAIAPADALRVATAAWRVERHFGEPQDVEWALDDRGVLHIVQARPLRAPAPGERGGVVVPGHRVLVRGAGRASGGSACGVVHHLVDPEDSAAVPEGAILVVPSTSPKLAGVLARVGAVVSAAGSPTGHMATVAREFGVPCLVGVVDALAILREGLEVTVDASTGVVYEGAIEELAGRASGPRYTPPPLPSDPSRANVRRLLLQVEPLTLTDPDSPAFTPGNCTTLHDIARFVHQRAMAEMFEAGALSARERRQARRLRWSVPMDVLVLDLGGGVTADVDRVVAEEELSSVPLLALLEGMTDGRLRWAGPVGFDLKGFMSVVVRSAADDQRYGEPSYAICARDYVHFSSRLAYHFATVEAICSEAVNENYARFLFFGGAAVAERREWRAHFLATVLRCNGFLVKQAGDRVEAILRKRAAGEIEDSLVMLGRLMVASRHLDMLMESRAAAESFAQAFLSGDYGFEFVRREAE
jgi:pyruvate, water dikinase